MRQRQRVPVTLVTSGVLQGLLALHLACAQGTTILATQPLSQQQAASGAAWQGDSTKQTPSNALQQGSVPGVVPQFGQNLDASHGGGAADPACESAARGEHSRAVRRPQLQRLDAQRHHERMRGAAGAHAVMISTPALPEQTQQRPERVPCGAWQANGACPLQCTSDSPAGCAQRFQCWNGCPACLPPPQAPRCSGFKQASWPLALAAETGHHTGHWCSVVLSHERSRMLP